MGVADRGIDGERCLRLRGAENKKIMEDKELKKAVGGGGPDLSLRGVVA